MFLGALHRKRTRSIVSARAQKNIKVKNVSRSGAWETFRLVVTKQIEKKKIPHMHIMLRSPFVIFFYIHGAIRAFQMKIIKREKTLLEHPNRKIVYGCSSTHDSSPLVWTQSRRVYCPKRVVILLLVLLITVYVKLMDERPSFIKPGVNEIDCGS